MRRGRDRFDKNIKQKLMDKKSLVEIFNTEKEERIDNYQFDSELKNAAKEFNVASNRSKYSYNFCWMGRPIIQYPQDMVAMQELIWEIKPELIIETGIAHGGSLVFYASILELIGKGKVIGIDIDIREHNKKEILSHPMCHRITMVEGDSISTQISEQIKNMAEGVSPIIVLLDSNHTHDHVLAELKLYSPLVTLNSYLVVFDTIIENMPKGMYDRQWDVGNNPHTALCEFLKTNSDFEVNNMIDDKLQISVAPSGYLKRIKK